METKYDIFISYRRVGGAQYARILQLMLIQRGYKVFLDYDELSARNGIFSDTIQSAIREAPIYMLILSKGSMDRCVNVNDWVREEITLAVQLQKYIIPINPDNSFDGFPIGMPENLEEAILSNQHAEISFGQSLGVTVDTMINNRIKPLIGLRKLGEQEDDTYTDARVPLRHKDENWNLFGLIRKLFIKDKNNNLLEQYSPAKVDYDIFISYRRIDGRDHARNIQQALKAHGYKHIFFDYDSIQKGEFNKRIIDAIYSCTDFILVLSPKSMKRCSKAGDPVANEIRTAVKYKKNIIPVTIDGREVKWPRSFPDDLKFIKGLQFHNHKSDSYFEHSIDKLCEKLTCEKV